MFARPTCDHLQSNGNSSRPYLGQEVNRSETVLPFFFVMTRCFFLSLFVYILFIHLLFYDLSSNGSFPRKMQVS